MSDKSENEVCGRHYATGEPLHLQWRDGIVTGLNAIESAPANVWIAPGLFDAQVNGYGGVDFQQNGLGEVDLLRAVRGLREAGCTRFLLTLITDEWTTLTARLRHLRELRSQSAELQAAIAGWHIEGPFLSTVPGFHGAHDPALMLDPTPQRILELRALTGDDPLMLTLSPERSGAIKAIELAVAHGVRVSLGHTNASAQILQQAVTAGATSFTHLGNGCPRELDRHDNILWRVFEAKGLMISLIPDRTHVSPSLFRILHRNLPTDSIYYVTDAMSAAGMPPGRYKLGKLELEVGTDQIVRQPGKPLFAGSALRPIDGVFRASEMLGCSWREAWRRFSEVPAKMMGVGSEIAVGRPADFCVVKEEEGRVVELATYAGLPFD